MALPHLWNPYPNPIAPSSLLTPPQTTIQSSIGHATTPIPVLSVATGQQFMAVPTYLNPEVPQPWVGSGMVQQVMAPEYAMAGQPLRYVPPIPNAYTGYPQAIPPGAMRHPGMPRYHMQYPPMMRPAYPPRPLVGVMPPSARSPVVGIRGPTAQVVVSPPAAPSVISAEKPQTTVYVGKISSTVENDFMLSLLQFCGPVKSWKRHQDPAGTLKGFGVCEFESAEGVLRALRLLNKLNIDGQELLLNVNQPTRVYIDHYVEKKVESSNSKDSNSESAEKEELKTSDADGTVLFSEESEKKFSDKERTSSKENSDSASFGLVSEEDRVADSETLDKLKSVIAERLRDRLLLPPRRQTAVDGPGGDSTSELHSASKDRASDGDMAAKDSEDKVDDEKTAVSKLSGYVDKNRTSSPDWNSRRWDRSKDRDCESKRDKGREVERFEREREQERARREKDKEHRSRDDDRRYKVRKKEWETRERETQRWRKREREREREKAQERKWEIMDQERDGDDAYGKKRRHGTSDEERKMRQKEKEEEEDIAEAKIRDEEEQKKMQCEMLQLIANQSTDETNVVFPNKTSSEDRNKDADEASDSKPTGNSREQGRHEEESYRKENKTKSLEKQKILDASQLIDTIPKTKDELFSYNINWTVYDLNALHERLRPWISNNIAFFLGVEEDTLVDYIVSTTQEHVSANEMLERLQTLLDDEAEMLVLKMWRMLIFEINKVETGLAVKSRS